MDQFQPTDTLVEHLGTVLPQLEDPRLKMQYVGFLTVSVVTVFELCIKEVLVDFASKKNKHFGVYCSNVFDRLNGRVTLKDLTGLHVKKFGEKYVSKFCTRIDATEMSGLKAHRMSIKSSYGNVIVWRHSFAHEGVLPANANYGEVKKGYVSGKEVIRCLREAMVR